MFGSYRVCAVRHVLRNDMYDTCHELCLRGAFRTLAEVDDQVAGYTRGSGFGDQSRPPEQLLLIAQKSGTASASGYCGSRAFIGFPSNVGLPGSWSKRPCGCVLSCPYPCQWRLVVAREPWLHLICRIFQSHHLVPESLGSSCSDYFGLSNSPQNGHE